jgi:imidazolonepropionase-like amidohydrolase
MKSKIVHGDFLVFDADTLIPSGAVYIEDGRVVDLGTYSEITARHKAEEFPGGSGALVIPGLVNAHGHGRAITDFQRRRPIIENGQFAAKAGDAEYLPQGEHPKTCADMGIS